MAAHLEASPPSYVPRDPSQTILYQVVAEHLETFLATLAADPTAKGLPDYVKEFYAYLQCGILAHGFVRLGCDTCPHQMLLAFSYKKRGFCPSCAGRRMAQMAAHLVEEVIPWVPTRQWVVSVPIPLRYWMAPSCASVHGFSLHANTLVPAHRRDHLERLLRLPPVGQCRWSTSTQR